MFLLCFIVLFSHNFQKPADGQDDESDDGDSECNGNANPPRGENPNPCPIDDVSPFKDS